MFKDNKYLLQKKIDYLSELIKNGSNYAFVDFSQYPERKLQNEDALKLYNSKEDVGVPKSALYFFLSEEEQYKHLDDLKSFDIDKCNDRFENFYRLHNLEVDRLKGHKNLSSIAI